MITIEVTDKEVLAALAKAKAALGPELPALLEAIGNDLKESTRLRFKDGRGPDGQAWKPLSPITRLLRRQGSGVPLNDTGRLKNSIIMRVVGDAVEVGTEVCYAPVHQFGARISAKPGNTGSNRCGPRKGAPFLVFGNPNAGFFSVKSVTIPARPFLGISAE